MPLWRSFNDPNKLFQVSVYCEDFNNTDPTSVYSINGTNIVRNMAYCYKRDSDSNNFQKFTVSSGNWAYNKNLTSGQFEWQTSTGRLEMKIPLSEIGSSTPGQNAWFNAVVVISKKVGAAWTDMDTFTIHYRVTGQNQSWIYGDFE